MRSFEKNGEKSKQSENSWLEGHTHKETFAFFVISEEGEETVVSPTPVAHPNHGEALEKEHI